ncbi:mannose/glucose-specific lectin-like [Prosopis cineraria]|uniref:mannose/glucose-specific lectin-like n=1 Tax=Prosopis cineraria TaxID=364024 RepID=UPI00240EA56F|nr:mannose/glucose-specific lectin-like [Prosopis cineraria]
MGSLGAVISLGPWGGPGGDNWSFKASRGITQIIVHEDVVIKSVFFKDANGYVSGKFGSAGGQERKTEIRWPSEYLKSISGTYGNHTGNLVIRSLSLITNLTTYGPFGTTAGGEPFSIPIADSVIVGFYGRAGFFLDAIGIFVQPVQADASGSISFGPWGGSGGKAFDFRVGSWIKEIIVDAPKTNIKSIAFTDANGHKYGKFGGKDTDGTSDEKKIEINGLSEYLTSISGTYGNYVGLNVITSLSFTTNLTTHGPFGASTGTSFSLPIQGSLVNGFHGRAGDFLDAIGIHAKPWDDIEESISIGPWGGSGGSPWSYATNEGINQIVINVGSNIKSISFQDTTGIASATFGGNNPNDLGERKTVQVNWPSEHLISISGTYGAFARLQTITSLSFTTNLATYGPFGSSSGTSFSIPISNNTIVGFHGKAGDYLDAIGIFVRPENAI